MRWKSQGVQSAVPYGAAKAERDMSAPLRIDRQGLIGLDWDLEKSEKSRMDAAEEDVTNRIRDVGHATTVANGRRARQMLQDVVRATGECPTVIIRLSLTAPPSISQIPFLPVSSVGRRMDPQNERGRRS